METAARPNSHNWFWIASLWAGLAIVDATHNVFAMHHEGMHHVWMKVFFVLTFDWLPWALVTPWVICWRAAIRRLGSRRGHGCCTCA